MKIQRRLMAAGLAVMASWGVLSTAAHSWTPAEGERRWSFPRDHGAHGEYRTEWWYVTGLLLDAQGRRYGYQLTFFRSGLAKKEAAGDNPWSVGDVYAGHFALTGVTARRFAFAERISRKGPGLAGSGEGGLDTWLLDWSIQSREGSFHLTASDGDMELRLALTAGGPPVLHGDSGLSRKGDGPGQASWYYSLPDMEARGTLRSPWTEGPVSVEGTGWFDHEFGSNQLSGDQAGWDWFSLRLDDGRSLMIYFLRRRDGTVEPASAGTIVYPDLTWRHLKRDTISLEVRGRWKSGRSGAVYPARWRIAIPEEEIALEIHSLVADQELRTPASTGVTYWEGAVAGRGSSGGRTVRAEGYVELTGYAGTLGGLF